MPKYRVCIHGKNFLMKSDKKEAGKVCFDTIRYVEAKDAKTAEIKAIEIIRGDSHLKQSIMNQKSDPPLVFVDSLAEVEEYDENNLITTAFRFYPDTGEEQAD